MDQTLGVAADETKVGRSIGNLSVTMTENKRLDVSLCTDDTGTDYDTEAIAVSGRKVKGLILSHNS